MADGAPFAMGRVAAIFASVAFARGQTDAPAPVRVFVLAGQSNMEGHGFVAADPQRNGGKGSLERLVDEPATAALFRHLRDADGRWTERDDVFVSYFDRRGPLAPGYGARPDRIGPELGFGHVVGDALAEPVLLIKVAWGGRSLAIDFRPPSAGAPPHESAPDADPAAVGKAYRDLIGEVRRVLTAVPELFPELRGRAAELAGFGWHQGWNDRIRESFNAEYSTNLAHLIRDVRRELGAPHLPFVIAETGMNGPDERHPRAVALMERQAAVAAMAEFQGNVAFVPTRRFWRVEEESPTGQGYHWNGNAETYYRIGDAMGRAMLELIGRAPRAADAGRARPRLWIRNGSRQAIEVHWLASDAERVPNGTVAPGQDMELATTLGHRFAVVGRDDGAEAVVESVALVQGFRFDPDAEGGVPSFYAQRASANGFPIVASARVNPLALAEAAFLVDGMLADRPDVRAAMIRSGARLCIMAHDEFTTDLPEFARLRHERAPGFAELDGRDYWDARARGLGGSERDPFCSCAEENLLGYPGDPYAEECILIHELAHAIHLRGMSNVDPTFDARVRAAYEAAMQAGSWRGKYASVNHHEYFAEGVQSWFDDNRENDHDHNHVDTRAELVEYDPALAALCREVFGETEFRYTKPAARLTGHLAGYDPAAAPTFVWPERLARARAAIRRAAEDRGRK